MSHFSLFFLMGDKSLEDLMRRRLAQWKMRTTNEHIGVLPGDDQPLTWVAVVAKRIMTGNVRDIGLTYLAFVFKWIFPSTKKKLSSGTTQLLFTLDSRQHKGLIFFVKSKNSSVRVAYWKKSIFKYDTYVPICSIELLEYTIKNGNAQIKSDEQFSLIIACII